MLKIFSLKLKMKFKLSLCLACRNVKLLSAQTTEWVHLSGLPVLTVEGGELTVNGHFTSLEMNETIDMETTLTL